MPFIKTMLEGQAEGLLRDLDREEIGLPPIQIVHPSRISNSAKIQLFPTRRRIERYEELYQILAKEDPCASSFSVSVSKSKLTKRGIR